MSLEIKTSIQINASPKKVWQTFTQFEKLADWNSFLTELSGNIKVGNKIKITVGNMKFKPKVLTFTTNKELKWRGRLLMPGIFDGVHEFKLIDNGDGTTLFEQNEIFKGILVPFFKSKLLSETKPGFHNMNESLKSLIEGTQP